jgi:hypothetical protein
MIHKGMAHSHCVGLREHIILIYGEKLLPGTYRHLYASGLVTGKLKEGVYLENNQLEILTLFLGTASLSCRFENKNIAKYQFYDGSYLDNGQFTMTTLAIHLTRNSRGISTTLKIT